VGIQRLNGLKHHPGCLPGLRLATMNQDNASALTCPRREPGRRAKPCPSEPTARSRWKSSSPRITLLSTPLRKSTGNREGSGSLRPCFRPRGSCGGSLEPASVLNAPPRPGALRTVGRMALCFFEIAPQGGAFWPAATSSSHSTGLDRRHPFTGAKPQRGQSAAAHGKPVGGAPSSFVAWPPVSSVSAACSCAASR